MQMVSYSTNVPVDTLTLAVGTVAALHLVFGEIAVRATPKTGLDEALSLEAVYYSAHIPRDLSVLTVLGAVFDRVHFPGVYLPSHGFDRKALASEIERVEALKLRDADTQALLGTLRFLQHVPDLHGLCVFDASPALNDPHGKMAFALEEAVNGKPEPGFHPMLSTHHNKALPGGDECVLYPGRFHYLAGAISYAGKTGMPLLNDTPGLPVGQGVEINPTSDAQVIAALLGIECVKTALPALPVLRPVDLMEFRAENDKTLRSFRRAMLRYAGQVRSQLKDVAPGDVPEAVKFFVNTEIVPALDELREMMNSPARAWHKRAIDFLRVVPELATAAIKMDPADALTKILLTYTPQLLAEFDAKADRDAALKRAGLYYLLRLRTYQERVAT